MGPFLWIGLPGMWIPSLQITCMKVGRSIKVATSAGVSFIFPLSCRLAVGKKLIHGPFLKLHSLIFGDVCCFYLFYFNKFQTLEELQGWCSESSRGPGRRCVPLGSCFTSLPPAPLCAHLYSHSHTFC